jgi:hypothetical protein
LLEAAPLPTTILSKAFVLHSVSDRLGSKPDIKFDHSGLLSYTNSENTGVYFYKANIDGKSVSIIVDWSTNPELKITSVVESDSLTSSRRLYN